MIQRNRPTELGWAPGEVAFGLATDCEGKSLTAPQIRTSTMRMKPIRYRDAMITSNPRGDLDHAEGSGAFEFHSR